METGFCCERLLMKAGGPLPSKWLISRSWVTSFCNSGKHVRSWVRQSLGKSDVKVVVEEQGGAQRKKLGLHGFGTVD